MANTREAPLAPADQSEEGRIYSKIVWRIVPLILLAYVLAFLDRINVGYVKLQMQEDLGFSASVYGLGAGLFFITYILLEVPSNVLMERIGARLTFLRIMVLWGLTSAATVFVTEPWQFYTLRLLLGAFEAGFFPGVILYLTYWFPSHRRGRVTGLFLFGIPLTGIVGGPISGMIMSGMDGVNGMAGWQWVFLIEGLPIVFVGLAIYYLLPNKPRESTWLTPHEKDFVESVLAADRKGQVSTGHRHLRAAFGDPKTFVLAYVYFTCACAVYTMTFWLPTMIKALGVESVSAIGWYTAIPYVFGGAGILLMSWSSDRYRERRWHVASTLIVGGVALYLTTFASGQFLPSMLLLCLAAFFIFASALFWAIPPTYLSADAAAAGIAVISSIGIFGGFVSPTLIGTLIDWTGSMSAGLAFMTAISVSGGLVMLALPDEALRVGGASREAAP